MQRPAQELERAFDVYLADVASGRRVAGKWERLAVERHREMESRQSPELRWNLQRGLRCCWWIERNLCYSKGSRWAGKPVVLQNWQVFVVASVFGWERLVEDRWIRSIRDVYMSMARKNGKSELGAWLMYVAMMFGGGALDVQGKPVLEQGAECYAAATTLKQAAISWRAAYTMAKKSPSIRKRLDLPKKPTAGGRFQFAFPESDSFFGAVSADSDNLDGLGPYFLLIDELHAHKKGGVWDVLGSGMGARDEPCRVGITTAGKDRTGVCGEVEDDGIKILQGIYRDDTKFVFICMADDDDVAFDPAAWPKPNPNYGVSVLVHGMQADAKTAQENLSRQNEFIQKRFNRWTAGAEAWLSIDRWDLSEVATAEWALIFESLRGREVYLGLDMASTTDTTSLSLVGRLDDCTYALHSWVFVPEDSIDNPEIRGPRERELMRRWADAGMIRTTPGDMLDYNAIWAEILNCHDRYVIRKLVLDRVFASSIIGNCEQVGIEVEAFGQGYQSMTPAIKRVEILIGSSRTAPRIRHARDEVVRWQISNTAIRRGPAEDVKFDKSDATKRIDATVSIVMPLFCADIAYEQGSGFFLGDDDEQPAEDSEVA